MVTDSTTGASTCQQCAENEFNLKRNGACQRCPDNTIANPERTKCDACATGYLQTSTTGQDLACNSCMVTFVWDATTKTCKPDASDKADEHALGKPLDVVSTVKKVVAKHN